MTALGPLLFAIGLAPLALGVARLDRSPDREMCARVRAGSVILCALAFNLTFFWQELWLVIPKALTPGLHPVLHHNAGGVGLGDAGRLHRARPGDGTRAPTLRDPGSVDRSLPHLPVLSAGPAARRGVAF